MSVIKLICKSAQVLWHLSVTLMLCYTTVWQLILVLYLQHDNLAQRAGGYWEGEAGDLLVTLCFGSTEPQCWQMDILAGWSAPSEVNCEAASLLPRLPRLVPMHLSSSKKTQTHFESRERKLFDFPGSFFSVCKTDKGTAPMSVKHVNRLWSYNMSIIGRNQWQWCGWALKLTCEMKEDRLKRQHVSEFSFYKILEKALGKTNSHSKWFALSEMFWGSSRGLIIRQL